MKMRLAPSGDIFATLGPVFFSRQPGDATVFAGQSATFFAVVDGTPPYSLQWKTNGVAIPGATNRFYTTPAAYCLDDGAVYTLCVSNDFSSVFSSNAVLRVLPACGPLVITRDDQGSVKVAWSNGCCRLQGATVPGQAGAWEDISGRPPFTLPITGAMRFFRTVSR